MDDTRSVLRTTTVKFLFILWRNVSLFRLDLSLSGSKVENTSPVVVVVPLLKRTERAASAPSAHTTVCDVLLTTGPTTVRGLTFHPPRWSLVDIFYRNLTPPDDYEPSLNTHSGPLDSGALTRNGSSVCTYAPSIDCLSPRTPSSVRSLDVVV